MAFNYHRQLQERVGSERELQLARRIQQSFLLTEFPRRRRLEVHAANVSSKEVSGDFYDVVPVERRRYLLAVADVSGRASPPRCCRRCCRHRCAPRPPWARRWRDHAHDQCARLPSRRHRAVRDVLSRPAVSERDMTLRFTNAGHNFPLLFCSGGGRRPTSDRRVGGRHDGGRRICGGGRAAGRGDRLVLYTDGVTKPSGRIGRCSVRTADRAGHPCPGSFPRGSWSSGSSAGLRDSWARAEAGDDVTVNGASGCSSSRPRRREGRPRARRRRVRTPPCGWPRAGRRAMIDGPRSDSRPPAEPVTMRLPRCFAAALAAVLLALVPAASFAAERTTSSGRA